MAGTGRRTQAVPSGASRRPEVQKYSNSLAVLSFYRVNFLPFLQNMRLLKKKKNPNTKGFFICILFVFRSLRKGGNAEKKTGKTLLSPPHPGIQLYHSLLCIVLQFLILRLMGRTITAILTTFCFQMVNVFPWAAQVTADSSWGRGGWGLWCRGSRGLGDPVSNPFSPRHLAVWLWVTCQKPQVFHLQAAVTMLHPPQGRMPAVLCA